MVGPKELRRELRLDEVQFHRFFRCYHYGRCLVIASIMKWESFSCKECRNFLEKGKENYELYKAKAPLKLIGSRNS